MSGPMNLVYPVAGDTTDTWGVVLNTMLGLVENHDHTSGKGSQVPTLGIGINADLGFAQYAITAAKAISFFPVTATAMNSYSGALWINSADSELYYRTTSGSNVKFTNGAALNVAAFTGGIGGDYSAVGALESFTDATHLYGFFQQVGAGVRQYGKIGSADHSLFEFKANPTAGVPANAVTLKSPNTLAASYSVTFPTALPAAASSLYIDAVGQLATKPQLSLQINASAGVPLGATAWTAGAGGSWATAAIGSQVFLNIPVSIPEGSVITGYKIYANKTTNATFTLTSVLGEWDPISHAFTTTTPGTGTEQNAANAPGNITLTKTGLSFTVATATGKSWVITVNNSASSAGDVVYSAEVTYQPV